jgi:hypothetical protein
MTVVTATGRRAAIVAAAQAAIGTRFRPQGRVPELALDCVGVALVAGQAAGVVLEEVPAYAINGDHGDRLDRVLTAIGCERVLTALPGDLLVVAPTPGRRHLAVVVPAGVIHAHAGLGRVVEGPLDPSWIILGVWRFPGVW